MQVVKLFLATTLFAGLLISLPASAHTLRSTGTVSAELHVAPRDHPIAGQNSTLGFEITTLDPSFSLGSCDCSIVVMSPDQSPVTLPVTPLDDAALVSSTSYIFPKAGDYTVKLTAEPRPGSSFAAFTLSYPVSVASQTPNPSVPIYAGLILVGIIVAILCVWGYRSASTAD